MVQSSFSPQSPQNVAVVIKINAGSFVEGFSLSVQILQDGQIIDYDDLPPIPAAPEMPQLYRDWQTISLENSRVLQAVPGQATNVSDADWRQRTTDLRDYCRTWFRRTAFRSLRDRIRANAIVHTDQSVPIIIKCFTTSDTENDILRRLPWHLWDLFSQLPNAEFALFTQFHRRVAILKAPIRVLAIFGSSDGGLQLEQDEAALQLLEQRGAEIIKISQPSEETLSGLLFDENWDILFFAGHSSSQGNSGTIQISEGNSLPLDALHRSLTRAVRRGLKLAIFNSCDGLGIADFLTRLNVPVLIVMREPVPDRIAGQFLLYLLREFSQGTPLFLAVREARERLESIEFRGFPAATWLPVICVNPNQPELVWPAPTPQPRPSLLSRLQSRLLRPHLVIGFAVLAGIIAVATPIAINRCQIFPSICHQPTGNGKNNVTDRDQNNIEDFISYGEKPVANSKVELSEKYLKDKQEGIRQFSEGKYEEAVKTFDKLHPRPVEKNKNAPPPLPLSQEAKAALQDPEILIYRNNAVVNARRIQNLNLPIYTIAVAAPLNIDAGMGVFFGVAQAQDVAVNRDKINLKVLIANDNNKPDQARRIAEKLYQDDNILAVVGHYTSENTCAALNVYSQQSNPLIVISPTSSVVNLSSKCGKDADKVFFRTVSSTRVEAESLVNYLTKKRKNLQPKVFVFYNSKGLFSPDLLYQFRSVLEAYHGKVIGQPFDLSDQNLNTRNLSQEVRKAIEEADALAVLPDGQTKDSTAFKNAIVIINWNSGKKPILGANTLYVQEVLNQPKKTIVDTLFLAVDWHPDQCGAKDFRENIRKYWGGDLNRRTTLAYEAVQAVLQTIKPNSPVIRTNDIQNKLSQAGIGTEVAASSDAIKGLLISFNETHDRREITTRAIATVKIVNNKRQFVLAQDVPCPN